MAFAQTVSITNTLSTSPTIEIDGGTHYWGFGGNATFLREQVDGTAQTADGRAKIKARIRFDVSTLDPSEATILSFKPRWSWNSGADNGNDGNRSGVAAWLKPWDFLEIGVGNFDGIDASTGAGPNFDWSEWSTWYHWGFNMIPGLVGRWQRASSLCADGLQVVYRGVPNLWIGAALTSARNTRNEQGYTDKETMIKKGMFNGLSLGAGYDTDLFGVGAVWKGNFGMEDGTTAELNDKSYQDHTIYASFTFKGLQEAKIGTNIYAAVGFYTAKASRLVDWAGYANANNQAFNFQAGKLTNAAVTSFLFDVGANFNFRNGISDDVAVAVGYYKIAGVTSKVLPFCVRNTIKYSASSDATFAFTLGYSQSGLAEKKQVAATQNTNTTPINIATNGVFTPTTKGEAGYLIFAYPSFTWSMGAHSFNMGVRTTVNGEIVPHAKTGWEWAWTGLKGDTAHVDFPISWTYTF